MTWSDGRPTARSQFKIGKGCEMVGEIDDQTVKPEERRVYLVALAQRCKKLAEAIENEDLQRTEHQGLQNTLIGAQLSSIVLIGIALAGPQLRDHFVDWVFARLRGYHGRCVACGKKQEAGGDVCADCLADVMIHLKEAGLDTDRVFG